jgi:hypothetical protein
VLDHEFLEQIKRLENAFGHRAFDVERCDIIRKSLRSISGDEFRHIANRFISSRKPTDPPLPKDFMEFALRRAGHKIEIENPSYIHCGKCAGVGVLLMKIDELETLAICDFPDPNHGGPCGQGDLQTWKLPKASQYSQYQTRPLPWQPFKPNKLTGNVLSDISEKVKWWREKVRVAEAFWSSLGR